MHVDALNIRHHGVTGEQRRCSLLASSLHRRTLTAGKGTDVPQSTEHAKHREETRR